MKLEQISIFLENRSGRLANILTTLGEAGVNIRAMSLADTSDFGILRLIVSDMEKARQVLTDKRFTVRISEVMAVEVKDSPGELAKILCHLEKAGINIEYMYSFLQTAKDSAIIIFRFDDAEKAVKTLRENGTEMIGNGKMW
ncbi:MAG: ACT domain-containing protein [Desulfococcaceae bacterium]